MPNCQKTLISKILNYICMQEKVRQKNLKKDMRIGVERDQNYLPIPKSISSFFLSYIFIYLFKFIFILHSKVFILDLFLDVLVFFEIHNNPIQVILLNIEMR